MTEDWSKWKFYAFPPFNMIGRVLQKVLSDQAQGIIVVPYWPTQAWFSKFTQMCNDTPFILFSRNAQPTLSHPWRETSTLPRTRFLVALISGSQSETCMSRITPKPFSTQPGDLEQGSSMQHTLDSGIRIVIQGTVVLCRQI